MTIVVGAASPVGIILASDSRTTRISSGGHYRIASDNARKVFDLGRIGAATYGMAFIGEKTIDGLIDEFIADSALVAGRGEAQPDSDVDAIARDLSQFFTRRLRAEVKRQGGSMPPKGTWPLGFLVAGYDKKGNGRLREIGIPDGSPTDTGVGTATRGALWRGQTGVIRRLVEGVDWAGAAAGNAQLSQAAQSKMNDLLFRMNYPITLQDAVDLTYFVIRTTIAAQRFTDGTYLAPGSIPGCGGPSQTLAVTPGGCRWIEYPGVVPGGAKEKAYEDG